MNTRKLKVWSDVRVRILAAASNVFAMPDQEISAIINQTPGRAVTPAAVRVQTRLRGMRIATSSPRSIIPPVPPVVADLVALANAAEPEYVPRLTWTPERESLLELYAKGASIHTLTKDINDLGWKVTAATVRGRANAIGLYRPVGFSPVYIRRSRLILPTDIEDARRSAAAWQIARSTANARILRARESRAADRRDKAAPYVRTNFVAAWLRPKNSGDPFRDAMTAVLACVPQGLDQEIRDEIAQDVALAMLEGGEMSIDPRGLVRLALARFRKAYGDRRSVSLDSVIPGTDSLRLIDTLAAPEPEISIDDLIDAERSSATTGFFL